VGGAEAEGGEEAVCGLLLEPVILAGGGEKSPCDLRVKNWKTGDACGGWMKPYSLTPNRQKFLATWLSDRIRIQEYATETESNACWITTLVLLKDGKPTGAR
jgi:hypothetical protein